MGCCYEKTQLHQRLRHGHGHVGLDEKLFLLLVLVGVNDNCRDGNYIQYIGADSVVESEIVVGVHGEVFYLMDE